MNVIRRSWGVLLAAGIGFVILCGLGTWQVQRLQWKNALIAELNSQMLRPAVTGEPAREYQRQKWQGALDLDHRLFKVASFHGGPGFQVLAPFVFEDGRKWLVDLGVVPARNAPLTQVTEIEGIVRLHNQGRGFFDPANDAVGNSWIWWDLPAMFKAAGIETRSELWVLQALPNATGAEAPEPKVELSNNHLGYAITWYGLAAALAAVAGVFVFQRKAE